MILEYTWWNKNEQLYNLIRLIVSKIKYVRRRRINSVILIGETRETAISRRQRHKSGLRPGKLR